MLSVFDCSMHCAIGHYFDTSNTKYENESIVIYCCYMYTYEHTNLNQLHTFIIILHLQLVKNDLIKQVSVVIKLFDIPWKVIIKLWQKYIIIFWSVMIVIDMIIIIERKAWSIISA